MTKLLNSELLIKGKIWNNEALELIDYNNYEYQKTEIKVKSSGILSRVDKSLTFTKGKNILKTPFELLSIYHNDENGYFYLNSPRPPKELIKVVEGHSIFMVYKGNRYRSLEDNIKQKYYKLSQGDIIKLGRIYLKVLDIQIEKEVEENKFGTEINNNMNNSSIFKSSSFRSMKVNGQEIIHGVFTPSNKLKEYKTIKFIDSLNKNDNINIFSKKYRISSELKNGNNPLALKKSRSLRRNNSAKEDLLFSYKNKKIKIKENNIKYNKNHIEIETREKLIKLSSIKDKDFNFGETDKNIKTKKNKIKKPKTCRICYGTDYNIENPLICPCICKGSMKYIHYECLKNWLNSKIETDLSINTEIEEEVGITYCSKDIACELCKTKFPDYINHEGRIYNISFYKPKFKKFIILESIRADKYKTKFIHILSFDNDKKQISLGRSNDCELSIPELSVSRFHCFIHKEKDKLFIEDNNSKFGTCVLLQNPNLLIIDNNPLRLAKDRVYVKLKLLIPSSFFSCCNTTTFDQKIFSYQSQNQKYCDVVSSFIIKEENLDDSDEEEENEENEIIMIKNSGDLLTGRGENNKKNKNIKKIKIKNESKEIIFLNKENKNKDLFSQNLPNIIAGLSTTKNNNLNLINVNKNNDVIPQNSLPIILGDKNGLLSSRDNNKQISQKTEAYSRNNKSNLLNNHNSHNKKKKDEDESIKLISEN